MTLAWVGQEEFSAGVLRASARGSEPGVGVITARNGLFDDDGDVYRRGGDTLMLMGASVGEPITFLWSGYLSDQPRTLFATPTRFFSYSALGATQIGGALSDGTTVTRPCLGAVVGEKLWLPTGRVWDGGATIPTWAPPASLGAIQHVAAISDRLVVAAGNRIAFSAAGNPTAFDPTDYHELPDGVSVVGMLAIRDTLLVFSNYGIWAIENMAYDLTDAEGNVQQSLNRITPELSLLHESGLCEWAGKIVAPCTDRVYLVDTISAPIAISDSIAPLYMTYVRRGYKPGGAKAFRNHIFIPILNGTTVVDLLVCRVNRPVRGRFTYYPWSTFDGHAGDVLALDVNMLASAPRFMAGGFDGWLTSLTDVFNPADTNASDARGVVHEFELQTRDYPTGSGQPNHAKRLRLYYTLRGQGEIQAAYSTGTLTQTYEALYESSPDYADVLARYPTYDEVFRGGESSAVVTEDDPDRWWQALPAQAFESAGVDPVNWNFRRAERARFIRAWFRCSTPVEKLVIHRIEFGVRPATHQR